MLQALVRKMFSIHLLYAHVYWKAAKRFPFGLVFSRMNPAPSAFLDRRSAPALWLFLWPSSGPTTTGPWLSCTDPVHDLVVSSREKSKSYLMSHKEVDTKYLQKVHFLLSWIFFHKYTGIFTTVIASQSFKITVSNCWY